MRHLRGLQQRLIDALLRFAFAVAPSITGFAAPPLNLSRQRHH